MYSSTCSSSHVSSFSSLLRASNLSTDCLSKPSSSCCSVLYNLTAVSMVNSLFLRLLFFLLLILFLLPCILLSHFPLNVSGFNLFHLLSLVVSAQPSFPTFPLVLLVMRLVQHIVQHNDLCMLRSTSLLIFFLPLFFLSLLCRTSLFLLPTSFSSFYSS